MIFLRRVLIAALLTFKLCDAGTIRNDELLSKLSSIDDELEHLKDDLVNFESSKKSDQKNQFEDFEDFVPNEVTSKRVVGNEETYTCGFEANCADEFTQSDEATIEWKSIASSWTVRDRVNPKGVSMQAEVKSTNDRKDYASISREFEIQSQKQCGEFYYLMYNQEGCDVARFLVTLQCGDANTGKSEVILKTSSSKIKDWQRVVFDINKAPGTKCTMTWRVSQGLADAGKVYIDDVSMYYQACPKSGEPDLAAHASCLFNDEQTCDWEASGDLEWSYQRSGSSTPSSDTGPDRPFFSYDTSYSKYIYVESSAPNFPGKKAILTSQKLISNIPQCMRVFVNMHGKDMGSLEALVVTGDKKESKFKREGDQGKYWFEAWIELPVDKEFQVELVATTGSGNRSDIALDDIKVAPGNCERVLLGSCKYTDDEEQCQYTTADCTSSTSTLGAPFEDLPEATLVKNQEIGTVAKINRQWSLSLEVKPETDAVTRWSNIIHFTTGLNKDTDGTRVPAIFLRPGTRRPYICTARGNSNNYCKDNFNDLNDNVYNKIELEQKKVDGRFEYNIKFDGHLNFTAVNSDPKEYYDVKVFAADNFYAASKAKVKDIEFKSLAAIKEPCNNVCEAKIEEATIDNQKVKSVVYDKYYCNNEKDFYNEIRIPTDVRTPRGACFQFKYKIGKSEQADDSRTKCYMEVFHRRVNAAGVETSKQWLSNLRDSYEDGRWLNFNINVKYDAIEAGTENRFGIKNKLHYSCSYLSFANLEFFDGPCTEESSY